MQLGSEKWWMCFSCEGFRASWSPSWKQNLEYIGHIILFGDGLNLKRKTQIWVMNVHLHQLLPLCPHYILPHSIWLVVWNIVYDILGMSSSQLTNISIIFQRGWNSTQPPTSHYTPWSSMIFHDLPIKSVWFIIVFHLPLMIFRFCWWFDRQVLMTLWFFTWRGDGKPPFFR